MMAYVQILRPLNLAIVVLTQSIIYYLVLSPQLSQAALSPIQFGLLTLCTAIIAGSGYLINDLYDVASDQINKPEKSYIPRQIEIPKAWRYYYFWICLGMIIAIYLAIETHNLPLLTLYPLSIWLLWLYARTLKKSGVKGNLIVAFMTSFVTLILSILVLILVNRSFGASLIRAITRPNPTLLLVGAVVLSLLVMSQFWPAMTSLFAFAPLHRADWMIAGGIALCLFALLEAMKLSPARTLTSAETPH